MPTLSLPASVQNFAVKYSDHLQVAIFLQALVAMLGSLYFSNYGNPIDNLKEGIFFHSYGGFEPCPLCWWARILMYPTVLVSAVGLLTQDKKFPRYTLAFAIPGIVLESYHYAIQKLPNVSIQPCSLNNPCSGSYINYFGFITIPFLCLVAFFIIGTISAIVILAEKSPKAVSQTQLKKIKPTQK